MVITIAITFVASLAFATPSVDFSVSPSGTANPLLHSTGFMSTVKAHQTAHSDFVKNAKFGSSRTHSWAEADMNQRVCDLHHVFPLSHLDTTAADSYFFKATDRKLYYAANCGVDVMYRLGVSPESPGYNFTTRVPTNFTAVADAMSHIISHYSSAKFASGVDYSSTITRWEIWNAPDDWERNWYEANKMPAELRTSFAQFFVTCLKKIRTDHPSVKVGGPALSKWDPDYMDAILDACEAEGVYPDFISYQCLTNEVDAVLSTPAQIRTWLDNRGTQYANCEIILSAWHYVPRPDGIFDNLDMDDVHNACFGTDGTMTATAAAFNLAVLGGLQSTPITRAYHAMTALRDPFSPYHWSSINTSVPHVAASVFQPFGEKLSSYAKVIPVSGNTGAVRAYAALSSDGATGCLAVANYKGGANAVQVNVSGLSAMSGISATVTDASHTNASVTATYSNGVLSLPAPDGASAAYFVTFSTAAPTPPTWPDCTPCNPAKKSTYDASGSTYSNQYDRIHTGTLPKSFDLVTIGDSITDFWDDKDLSGYNSLSPSGADGVFNLGIGADQTQNVIWRLEQGGELENYTTKFFTLMIGGNNLAATPTPEVSHLVAATERILYNLKTAHPEAKILMMPMLTHDRGNLSEAARKIGRQMIIDVNDDVMTNVDNKTVFWLDLRDGFPLTSAGTLDNAYWTPSETSAGTYVHPSAKGYQEVFDVRVAAAMAKYGSVATGTAQATDPSIGFVFPPDAVFSNDFQVTGIYLGTDASAVPATTYDLYYQVDGAGGWTKVLSAQTRKTVSMSVPAVAAGSHTCQFKVVTSANKEALSASVPFTVTSPVVVTTYYKVGTDPSDSANQNSWKKSCSSTVGWSSTLGGTVDSTHTVSSDYDYVIPDGAVLRSPGRKDTGYKQSTLIPFAGKSLTVQTGGTLALQSYDDANKGVNIVSVPQLIGAGGIVAHYTSGYYKILKGGSITLNEGGLIFRLNGDRYLDVQSSVSGSGPIKMAGQATVGTQPYLYFTGDMSGFTGTIENATDTDNMVGLELRFTQPNFGGTVTSLPKYAAKAVFNHAGLETTGVRCIGTSIPDVLKTKLVYIGVADVSAANLPLLSFPKTISASASDFTVKYAATAADAGTAFTDLAIIDGANNTQVLVANYSTPKITVTVSGFTHAAIQTAVDTVAANAVGGKVIVPAGTYECEGSIELKSNVELNLASGAILNATTNWRNFAELPTTAYERTIERSRRVFIWGTNMTDVAITGEGRIEGQGPLYFNTNKTVWATEVWEKPTYVEGGETKYVERPILIRLNNSSNVTISDITVHDAPVWTFHLRNCENVLIDNVTVDNNDKIVNSDGFDIDGCRHVRLLNCETTGGDDAVAIRANKDGNVLYPETYDVVISNLVTHNKSNIRIGCPSDNVISNVVVRDVTFNGGTGIYMDYSSAYVSSLYGPCLYVSDILVENITGSTIGEPIQIKAYSSVDIRKVSDVTIRNVNLAAGTKPQIYNNVTIAGTASVPLENVTLSNVVISAASGSANGTYSASQNLTNYQIFDSRIFGVDYGKTTPSSYGVIDYVKSTRTQYLVTDYYPNPKTWMEAVVGFSGTYRVKTSTETSNFISAPADSAYACYGLNIGNSKGDDETTIYAWLYKGSGSGEKNLYGKQKFGTSLTASTNTLVVQNGASNSFLTWGGTAMTTIKPHAKTTTCANPLAIFGSTTMPFAHYDFSVYSIKIYESDDGTKGGANEVLKHDFIPATNALGVAGLYDRVAKKFFGPASGTPLVAGIIAPVKPTPTISGTLVMNGWEAGETPSQPSGLTTDLGTLVYRYYTDSACTQSMATPTTSTPAGTYYVRGEVDASASWNAAVSAAVAFTVTAAPGPGPTPWPVDERSAFLAAVSTNANRVASSPFAKGGIIHKLGDDYIHIFTDDGTITDFSVTNGDVKARVLLVAGGGSGGGKDGSAGGGAGGMVTSNDVSFAVGTYAVQVGYGAPANTTTEIGTNGGNSSISNATEAVCTIALGGGGGGAKYDKSADGAGKKGNDGGSGGGAGCYAGLGAGKGTDGQGHNGGAYYGANYSGGGGGAGSDGVNATSSKAGNGGAGLSSDILGLQLITTFAGGGGGGARVTNANREGKGSDGGGNGGRGQWSSQYLKATDGEDGRGSGGGGSGGGDAGKGIRYGGAGGSGIVVIRYTDPTKAEKLPKVYITSVTPNNDATATIAWSMTGAAPLTLKALYGVDSTKLNITNTISTTATPGEDSTTLGGLLPGRTYYVSLLAENSYGNSGAMLPTSFTMPADGPMPQTPTAEMPVIVSKTVKDQTGLTTIYVLATLSQAGTGSSFADCTATVRWGTENILAQMTSSKSASVASDGTVTISPDNLGVETYYGCIEVVNANGRMDRVFFSFRAADTSTYQWKAGVTEGAWKDRNSWTGAPNDWGGGYPTEKSVVDMSSVSCATVHVAGVTACAKINLEVANATYVFVGDDATAALQPLAKYSSSLGVQVPSGCTLIFDNVDAYLRAGSSSYYGLTGSAKLVIRNGSVVTVLRSEDKFKERFEVHGAEARLEIDGADSKIIASRYCLAENTTGATGGIVVLSGASPSVNLNADYNGYIFARNFDGTIVCNIPAEGWANAVIPSNKLNKFAQGGNNSGSGKIVFTVPKTAPIRGAKDKTKTESAIVSCDNGIEVSRVTFGQTARNDDYFYYTLGDDKYVYCTTNAAKLAAIDAPGVALETQPPVTALKYHHEPPKGLVLLLR